MTRDYDGIWPEVDEEVFIAETAALIGQVKVGRDSSVWYGAVLRGDEAPINVGRGCSIQDNVILHCDKGSPIEIGDNVTVGHGAIVHGAVIGKNTLIGMGAIVLNGAVIGENCVIGAGAVVKENAVVPPNSMLVGVPGKVIRELTPEQVAEREKTSYYVELSKHYLHGSKGWDGDK